MRILYGVQGTGNGHTTRARMLGPALQHRGIEVDYLFSGRDPDRYFNMEPFGNYQTRNGFTLVASRGRVNLLKTLSSAKLGRFIRDVNALDLNGYDLVVSDFEPVTAWAARRRGVRSVGIAHQYAFMHSIPGREYSRLSHLGIPCFTPVDIAVGLHWAHFDKPILPPMVAGLQRSLSFSPRQVLVYLPFEELERVIEFLKSWPSYDFHIFAAVDQPYQIEHINVQPLSREAFQQRLASCAGLFTNAGFGACSEAIQAGKSLLVKPLAGQFEQAANAAALKYLDLGREIQGFDDLDFEHWLSSLTQPLPARPWCNTAELLADWIADGCHLSTAELAKRAWSDHSAASQLSSGRSVIAQ